MIASRIFLIAIVKAKLPKWLSLNIQFNYSKNNMNNNFAGYSSSIDIIELLLYLATSIGPCQISEMAESPNLAVWEVIIQL